MKIVYFLHIVHGFTWRTTDTYKVMLCYISNMDLFLIEVVNRSNLIPGHYSSTALSMIDDVSPCGRSRTSFLGRRRWSEAPVASLPLIRSFVYTRNREDPRNALLTTPLNRKHVVSEIVCWLNVLENIVMLLTCQRHRDAVSSRLSRGCPIFPVLII